MFDVEVQTKNVINWIKNWFDENGPDSPAVIGISGGKDSTIVAALLCEALGCDRVIGILMPQHVQEDIDDSIKVCEFLGIKYFEANIGKAYDCIMDEIKIPLTEQAKINLAPRLRMSTLYAYSQCLNGRVVNTCNLSETLLSWETRWGDAVGDFAPIANFTVDEVKKIGYFLHLPEFLIEKTPSDGLCGASDEEKMGILYSAMDSYIRTGNCSDKYKEKIDYRINFYRFKRRPIPSFNPELPIFLD